jgi:hypothetical protein
MNSRYKTIVFYACINMPRTTAKRAIKNLLIGKRRP